MAQQEANTNAERVRATMALERVDRAQKSMDDAYSRYERARSDIINSRMRGPDKNAWIRRANEELEEQLGQIEEQYGFGPPPQRTVAMQ